MLKYYIKISFREILRKKIYTLMIIFGFTIGLTAWLFIVSWMDLTEKELEINKHIGKMFRIGFVDAESSLVWQDSNLNIHSRLFLETPYPLADLIKKFDSAEVDVTRFGYYNDKTIISENHSEFEKRIAFSDNEFFDFYSFPLVSGDFNEFYTNENSVILNKRTADKYFPEGQAVGKTLNVNNEYNVKVIAVIKNIPAFYKIQFDFLLPINQVTKTKLSNNWLDNNVYTVVRIKENADLKAFYKRMNDTLQFHRSNNELYNMYPFVQYNNYSDIRSESGLGSNLQFIYIFSAISIYLLFVACLNYFNISMSNFYNKSKEIATRKSFGAKNGNIIVQLLLEGQLISMFSFCLALVLFVTLLPYFNQQFSIDLKVDIFYDFILMFKLLALTFLIGFIASVVPAFIYSKISPARIFSSSVKSGSKNINFMRLMSFVQFSISIAFMVATLKVDKQLEHLRNSKEGFDESYSIEIPLTKEILMNYDDFENELQSNKHINSIFKVQSDSINYRRTLQTKLLTINIKPINISSTIDLIQEIWSKYNPDTSFDYLIPDADFHKEFAREQIMSKLFKLFSVLLILITSTGFVIFSNHLMEQRKEEIAIRKVYGASTINIYFMLLKEFMIMGLLSIITAHIFVFFTSITWLNKFSSKISDYGVSGYLIPTIVAIIMLILSISFNAIKASMKSPGIVLRGE